MSQEKKTCTQPRMHVANHFLHVALVQGLYVSFFFPALARRESRRMSQGKNTPFGLKLVAINLAAGGSAGLSQHNKWMFWGRRAGLGW